MMGYMFDVEITTERERHYRNFAARINRYCGLGSNLELAQLQIEQMMPFALRAHQIRKQEAK